MFTLHTFLRVNVPLILSELTSVLGLLQEKKRLSDYLHNLFIDGQQQIVAAPQHWFRPYNYRANAPEIKTKIRISFYKQNMGKA
jgi:hypothetical protein